VAEWRHNLKLSNFRHTQQDKVCTDGIHACIEYCCKEQWSCHCTQTVCNKVCTVDKDWSMMDRPTLSSEREHEETATVVSQNIAFCLSCILLWFLVNDQLDAQFFSICLFQFSTCFEQPRAHHQENQLYQYIWYMSLCVCDIYQMLYWYNWFSWWWARGCSKHVDSWNKHIEKNCASSWSFTNSSKAFTTIASSRPSIPVTLASF
jgi:hypothetical protein